MIATALILSLLACQEPKPLNERSLSDLTTDDKDGAFDVSEFLLTRGAFLPVPIIITEPAVGYGGGLGGVFFHEPPFGDPDAAAANEAKKVQILPKSVSFAAGMGTENGTWFAGGGHFEAWDEGAWRLMFGGGLGSVNLKYYGIGGEFDLQDAPQKYNLEPGVGLIELQRRVIESFLVGVRYVYLDATVSFDRDPILPGIGVADGQFRTQSAGLGVLLSWDSRDNLMTPSSGLQIDLRPQIFDEALGSDAQFYRLDAIFTGYLPVDPFIFGARIDAGFAGKNTPFYQMPYVELRGVPAMRYLGDHVISAEAQVELSLTTRWSILAFGGAGRAELHLDQLDSGSTVYAGGGGFRYLIARRFGLKVGVDVAASTDDWAFYIQIGTAWR